MLPRIDPTGGPADVLDSLRAGGLTVAQLMCDTGRSDTSVRRCLWSLRKTALVHQLGISWHLTQSGRSAVWALDHGVPTHQLQIAMALLAMLVEYGPVPKPAPIRSQDRLLASMKKLGLIAQIGTRLQATEAGTELLQKWRDHEQRQ